MSESRWVLSIIYGALALSVCLLCQGIFYLATGICFIWRLYWDIGAMKTHIVAVQSFEFPLWVRRVMKCGSIRDVHGDEKNISVYLFEILNIVHLLMLKIINFKIEVNSWKCTSNQMIAVIVNWLNFPPSEYRTTYIISFGTYLHSTQDSFH